MAVMLPDYCTHNESDKEYLIFEALRRLPQEYYVLHDYHIVFTKNKTMIDHECDFLVFHPEKGFLCIEAKWGKYIRFENRQWYYSNGKETDPFEQAEKESKTLIEYINERRPIPEVEKITDKCKFLWAVWFHGMDGVMVKRPECRTENSDPSIILSKEDLVDPEKAIERIFNGVQFFKGQHSRLNSRESKLIIDNIINCQFSWTATYGNTDRELSFIRLLEEQKMCLDFMRGERTVSVIGGAGTGKTIIAMEQAKRLAKNGDSVLFLCYNAMLLEKLQEDVSKMQVNGKITVMNIDSFVLWLTGKKNDYKSAAEKLGDLYLNGEKFTVKGVAFDHVVIDEAQDFARQEIENSQLLENLQYLVSYSEGNGSFCAFYDKNQFIESITAGGDGRLPKILENSMCRIPLKTNCRNTRQISNTSLGAFMELEKLHRGREIPVLNNVKGEQPWFYFCNGGEEGNCVKSIIRSLTDSGDSRNDIAVLTLKTEEKSILKGHPALSDGRFDRCFFTSIRKFKGLERKSVILCDFDKDVFSTEISRNNFYVGATRARFNLFIVSSVTDDDIKEILMNDFKIKPEDISRPKVKFCMNILGAVIKEYGSH